MDSRLVIPSAEDVTAGAMSTRSARLIALGVLTLFVAVSRFGYMAEDPMHGKDGPLYIESLRLDHDYCVPMPGNLGYVVLGKFARKLVGDPIEAYVLVNIGLTIVGAIYTWQLGRLLVSGSLAASAVLAMVCNPMVWWHGATINSYLVWLAVLPAVGYHGYRYYRERELRELVASSLALGIGTALRQDLLLFGGPLWIGCLLLGRTTWKRWLIALSILGVCCLAWFGGMSLIMGGPWEYLARVRAKHAGHMEGFSVERRGLVEGLLRNGSKYALFLLWAVPVAIVPFLLGLAETLRGRRLRLLLALLWVGPSWWFSIYVFAGNAGLIFPLLPLIYLGAARGLDLLLRHDGPIFAVMAMYLIAAASMTQFMLAPILPETDQRNVIMNVTFLRYSGTGLRGRFDKNLDEYGIDPSLRSVMRQVRDPEPIPGRLIAGPVHREEWP